MTVTICFKCDGWIENSQSFNIHNWSDDQRCDCKGEEE